MARIDDNPKKLRILFSESDGIVLDCNTASKKMLLEKASAEPTGPCIPITGFCGLMLAAEAV